MLTAKEIDAMGEYLYGKNMGRDGEAHRSHSVLRYDCFVYGATWANEQNIAEIKELKFKIEGDAVLLKAANQTIEKERAKVAKLESALKAILEECPEKPKLPIIHSIKNVAQAAIQ